MLDTNPPAEVAVAGQRVGQRLRFCRHDPDTNIVQASNPSISQEEIFFLEKLSQFLTKSFI